jgi:hypothetical protein
MKQKISSNENINFSYLDESEKRILILNIYQNVSDFFIFEKSTKPQLFGLCVWGGGSVSELETQD